MFNRYSKFKMILIPSALVLFVLFCSSYVKYKKVYFLGDSYNAFIKELDLSDTNINNLDDFKNDLAGFKFLKKVNFGNKTVSKNEKDNLSELYPEIDFDVDVTFNIYGLDIKENITYLDLSTINIDDNIIDYLKYFPNLKKVDFGNNKMSLDFQLLLKEKYKNIEFIWNVDVLDLRVSSDIKSLSLHDKNIDNISNLYKSLSLLTNLEYLDMANTNLSNEELAKMRSDFPNVKIAWIIHLGKWSLRTDDVAFSVLITKFDYKRMTNEDIEVLKYCTDLQALDLGHQNITDISVITNYLKDLRILILADNKISDISGIGELKHLHFLELFINKIKDFSPLKDNKELVDLNLCYNRINNYDFVYELTNLERLWLVGTGISNAMINNIKEKYPNILIDKVGPGSTDNGWRSHKRYFAMIDMFHKKNYISEEFRKYDS